MDFYLNFAKESPKQTIIALNNHYYDYYPKGVSNDSSYVEISNSHAELIATNIIQLLKQQTGDDLGDNPKAWIDKYYKREPEETTIPKDSE